MKKFYCVAACALLLSGCATYKFQRGKPPYDEGYEVYRNNHPISAYTLGPDNSVPSDLTVAKERFKRRRERIEEYEKEMGTIDNRLKQVFWGYPVMTVKLATGVFRLPFVAMDDYRYKHDPAYRQKVQQAREKADLDEETRMQKLKKAEYEYILKDLEAEGLMQERQAVEVESLRASSEGQVPAKEASPETTTPVPSDSPGAMPQPVPEIAQLEQTVVEKKSALEQLETNVAQVPQGAAPTATASPKPPKKARASSAAAGKKQKPLKQDAGNAPAVIKAVIVARPARGYSPLRVAFYAGKSYSSSGRIIAYRWDFGDGDTSLKKNSINTFWSGSSEPQHFNVTLTASDDKGNSDTASQEIEVLNK